MLFLLPVFKVFFHCNIHCNPFSFLVQRKKVTNNEIKCTCFDTPLRRHLMTELSIASNKLIVSIVAADVNLTNRHF